MLNKERLLNKNFILFFIVIAQASLGSSIAVIALAFLVLQLTGSASAMAITLGLRILPNIFLPFIATFIDRVNVKIPLSLSFLLRGLLLVALYLMIETKLAGISAVYVIALINGILATVTMPSCQVLIPNLVGKNNLVRGNSILNMAEQSMSLFGYLAGGAIVAWLGPLLAVLLEGIAYLCATVLIFPINVQLERAKSENHFWQDMAIAWRFMYQFKPLALVTIMCFFINAFFASIEVFLPLHMKAITAGAAGYGVFMGAMMVGMLSGSFAITVFARWFSAWRAVSLGWLALAIAFSGLGFVNNFISCLVWGVALGLGVTAINTSAGILFQKTLNVQYRGRLNGLSIAISNLGMPITFFAISLSIHRFEFSEFFAIGSIIALLFALFWFLYCQRQPKQLFEQEYQFKTDKDVGKANPEKRLMYLLFTSGSTGKPKGVMLSHQGIVNRLHWMQQQYPLTEHDVVLQKTPYTFDVSVWELFWPLLNGASLCFAKPEGHKDPFYLQKLIEQQAVTTLHFVPSMLRAFLESLTESQLKSLTSLRQVFCSGEALPTQLANTALAKLPTAKLYNLYGPTEASIDVSYWDCSRSTESSIAPIGQPIQNTKLFILDKYLQPLPIGVAGELYIAGDGLANGYIGQPDLTANHFIDNPFVSEEDKQRGRYLTLYQTGDLARYLSDGTIEYLGRTDEQVKIRGFRIELGEVAAVLMQHAAVSQAVVIVKTIQEEQQLVAYYVAEQAIGEDELRDYLSVSLPDYMLPAYLVHLSEMPLNNNGKVNKARLPEVDFDSSRAGEYVAARTVLEQQLVTIWKRVLKKDYLGVQDDFFLAGGNSLTAIQIAAKIQRELQLSYAINQLFNDRMIAQQAKTLTAQKRSLNQVGIVKVDRAQSIVASSAQQRLWFIDQYENGEQGHYHIAVALRLLGELDHQALQKAVDYLVIRHESFRTYFKAVNGEIHQLIASELKLSTELERIKKSELKPSLQQKITEPFDLKQAPLTRLVAFEVSEKETVLLIVQHHIISDGWSIKILLEELAACYAAALHKQSPGLNKVDYQVADFTLWQQQFQNTAAYSEQVSYWQQKLADYQTLTFPSDYSRPPRKTYHGRTVTHPLTVEMIDKLKKIANEAGASLFMLLITVLKLLLQRYSNQEDMVIGTPVAGRNQAAFNHTSGLFVNTLVLRSHLAGNPLFSQLLEQVKQTCLEAFSNQDVPFEKLLEILQVERDPSCDPVFQIMFVLDEEVSQLKIDLLNMQTELLDLESDIAKFDLTIYVEQLLSSEWRIKLEYNTDLFQESTMQRLALHFSKTLSEVIENPNLPIHAYEILSQEEKEQQLIEFNLTDKQLPNQYCLHEPFDRQAELTPTARAVASLTGNLTYHQLRQRSNQIANKLIELQVKPNTLVAVCMTKGVEQVIAVLGILKAGAAYLPISSKEPEARIKQLLEQGEVSVVLTQKNEQERIPANYSTLAIDEISLWRDYSLKAPTCPANYQDLAYVIFTSGSTGVPKGVMIKHESALNTINDINLRFNLTANDKVLALSALNFDLSVYDMFACLYVGAQIILPAEQAKKDPESWLELIEQHEITVWNSVPALLQMLLDYIELNPLTPSRKQALSKMRLVLLSGDWLPLDLPEKIKHFADCQVISLGGATEGSIWSILNPVDKVDYSRSSIPYGKPMWNQQFFIRDSYLQLLPKGIPGELCIGGVGVAEGYWNNHQKTAESFVEDPVTGETIYRTGDMGRYLEDGTIEFLGRQDSQVKLRGFRVELGDIETCLKRYPTIEKAVVLLHEQQSLVAYYVNQSNEQTEQIALRHFLKSHLPEYMIPASFIRVDALPLTNNGKVDKKALLKLFEQQEVVEFIQPRSKLAQQVSEIWQCVLQAKYAISLTDNFFHLGGNSLLVIQLLSHFQASFHCQLTLRELFENPLLSEQVKLLENISQTQGDSDIKKSNHSFIPLSFAQQRLWFLHHYQGQQAANYNIPIAIQLSGLLDAVCLEIALNKLMNRQQSLQTVFVKKDGVLQQQLKSEMMATVSVEQATLEALPGLLKQQSQHGFDLIEGPLLRVTLYQINHKETVLLINVHHIISDGVSMKILLNELSELYLAEVNEQAVELVPLPIQYADYAAWQSSDDQVTKQQNQLAYWQQQLAKAEPLQLPLDYPRPAIKTYQGAQYHFELPKQLVDEFSNLLRENNCTLYMGLLSIFAVLLARYSQQDDIIIGSPVSNRQQQSTQNLIGLFVNTLALRIDFSTNPDFIGLLTQLRETCLEAFSNSDVPFEKVIDSLNLVKDASRDPVFQVLLSYEDNTDLADLQFAQLPGEELTVDYPVSKFDLSLYVIKEAKNISCYFEYNTDLFKAARLKRMAVHFINLIKAVLESCTQSIKELLWLSNEETNYLYYQLNQTDQVFPEATTIHSLFIQQAQKKPDAVAVVDAQKKLTYQQLDEQSNQLARYLQQTYEQQFKQPLSTDCLIAVGLERQVDLLVTLLAILKTGAAYLPLTMSYPCERLQFMLEESQAKLMIVDSQQAEFYSSLKAETQAVYLDHAQWRLMEADPLPVNSGAHDLIYVIYTSGSTGKPKGVMLEHQAIVNRLCWMQANFSLTAEDTVLQKTPYTFDVSVWELFWPILSGAKLYFTKPEAHKDPLYLAQVIQSEQITCMHFVPSMLKTFLKANRENDKALASLRQVFCSGEALPMSLVDEFNQQLPQVKLYNLYGPTEAAIDVSYWDCCQPSDILIAPIGQPIDNIQLYVLDQAKQPVPQGVTGELYIAGVGLARAYLGRPELTEERFEIINHPQLPVTKLYKTGDLVRYLEDGNLEYLGRSDDQVKLRGFRIELGEIASALNQHTDVAESAVITTGAGQQQQLVAFFVPKSNQSAKLSSSDLRDNLSDKLPEYMVPSHFVEIEAMPLSSNGKLDKQALTNLLPELQVATDKNLLPKNELEQTIAMVWKQILNIKAVNTDANFFTVGGNSLLAVELCSELQALDYQLRVVDVFKAPTIVDQASLLEQSKTTRQADQSVKQANDRSSQKQRMNKLLKRKRSVKQTN